MKLTERERYEVKTAITVGGWLLIGAPVSLALIVVVGWFMGWY